jgi:hypothetical protein
MNDPKMAPLQLESQYLLGKTLYAWASTTRRSGSFSQILGRGKTSKFFGKSLEWLFFISHKTVERVGHPRRGGGATPTPTGRRYRYKDEFHYLLAPYHFVRGRALDTVDQKVEAAKSFEEARKLALTILRALASTPRPDTWKGSPGSRDGKMPIGLEAMKEVVRVTRPSGSRTPPTPRWQMPRAIWPSCSWRASTMARARTATPSILREDRAREAAVARGALRVCVGETTASDSTSRRSETSSPCPAPSSATSTSPRR